MNTDRMFRVRHRHAGCLLGFALVLAACAAPASPSPVEPSNAASESTAPASADPTASPTASPTATPNPTCPPVDFAAFLASERLSDASVAPGTGGDLVGFVLVPSPGSPLRPRLTITSVEPPFSEHPRGLPLEVAGEHHILVRFEGMLHVDDAGVPVYVGPRDQQGIGGPVRQILLTEAFESYVSFIVGYDGDGCVALSVQPTLITIAIAAR